MNKYQLSIEEIRKAIQALQYCLISKRIAFKMRKTSRGKKKTNQQSQNCKTLADSTLEIQNRCALSAKILVDTSQIKPAWLNNQNGYLE